MDDESRHARWDPLHTGCAALNPHNVVVDRTGRHNSLTKGVGQKVRVVGHVSEQGEQVSKFLIFGAKIQKFKIQKFGIYDDKVTAKFQNSKFKIWNL